jgi:hypothetical protein
MLVLQLTGYLIALTESELSTMLKAFPTYWEAGLKRGKGVKRSQSMAERTAKY